METMTQASRSRGAMVWLRETRRHPAPVRRYEEDSTGRLFFRNLLRGITLLPPVSMLMMLLAGAEGGGSPNLAEIFLAGLFISLYALVPAVTGGLLYLPAVLWAARRWPRRARAIAVAAAPLVALGTLPFGMAGFVALWWVAIPVFAGLLLYGAVIDLPAPSPSPAVEGGR